MVMHHNSLARARFEQLYFVCNLLLLKGDDDESEWVCVFVAIWLGGAFALSVQAGNGFVGLSSDIFVDFLNENNYESRKKINSEENNIQMK